MHSTAPITHHAGFNAADEPPAERLVVEPLNLLDAVPIAGPPAILLVGPLVLLALIVAGPFLALLTIAAVLAVAGLIVLLAGAILASPYLLLRHLR
jgi:hypothetical protein